MTIVVKKKENTRMPCKYIRPVITATSICIINTTIITATSIATSTSNSKRNPRLLGCQTHIVSLSLSTTHSFTLTHSVSPLFSLDLSISKTISRPLLRLHQRAVGRGGVGVHPSLVGQQVRQGTAAFLVKEVLGPTHSARTGGGLGSGLHGVEVGQGRQKTRARFCE